MARARLEVRLGLAVLAACLAASVAATWAAGRIFGRAAEGEALSALRNAAEAFAAQERGETEKLAATLGAILEHEPLRAAFVARDRPRTLAVAAPLFARMSARDRITQWYFIEPEPARTVFLRVHRPELHGDPVERVTLQRAIETHDFGAGKELGQTAFALRAVRPWFHQGTLLGYVELAEEVDDFLAEMKSRTGDDYVLLMNKRFVDEDAWIRALGPRASTWNDRPDAVVAEATIPTAGIVDDAGDLEALPGHGRPLGEVERDGRTHVRGLFPLTDAMGRKVGALLVVHDFTAFRDALRASLVQYAAALLAIGAAVSLLVVAAAHRLVFARLARLRAALERQGTDAGAASVAGGEPPEADEIGRLERHFRRVLGAPPGDGGAPPDVPPRRA